MGDGISVVNLGERNPRIEWRTSRTRDRAYAYIVVVGTDGVGIGHDVEIVQTIAPSRKSVWMVQVTPERQDTITWTEEGSMADVRVRVAQRLCSPNASVPARSSAVWHPAHL